MSDGWSNPFSVLEFKRKDSKLEFDKTEDIIKRIKNWFLLNLFIYDHSNRSQKIILNTMYNHMKKIHNLTKSDKDFSALTIWTIFWL